MKCREYIVSGFPETAVYSLWYRSSHVCDTAVNVRVKGLLVVTKIGIQCVPGKIVHQTPFLAHKRDSTEYP